MKFSQKKIFNILLLTAFSLILISCSKREDELSNEQYVGTWTWKSTNGSIGNTIETAESTGITKKLLLAENYHYSISENDVLKTEGMYSIEKGVTSTDHSEKLFLVFDGKDEKIVLQVDATNLIFSDDHYDGFTYYYEK